MGSHGKDACTAHTVDEGIAHKTDSDALVQGERVR